MSNTQQQTPMPKVRTSELEELYYASKPEDMLPCSKKEYKMIYLKKDEIQRDFIENMLVGKITYRDYTMFIVSLMCEFVDNQKGMPYFALPALDIEEDENVEGRFDIVENKVFLADYFFEYLYSAKNPAMVFMKLVDTVGHEMTHYKQFRRLCNKLKKKHDAKIINDPFFTQDDELFDEWTIKVLRPTLSRHDAKRIRYANYELLQKILNYNHYFFAKSEVEARKGGLVFLDKMMARWKEWDVSQTFVWKRILRLQKSEYFKKLENSHLKSSHKLKRKLSNKFLYLVPNLEETKRLSDEKHLRQNLLTKSLQNLESKSDIDIKHAILNAVCDGNDVMLPYLIDFAIERFSPKDVKSFMDKMLKIILKNSICYDPSKSSAHVNMILQWSGYSPVQIAEYLFKSVESQNTESVFLFFKLCKDKGLTDSVACHVVRFLN